MENKPSVVHFIDSLEPGGAERVAINLSNLFFNYGHRVGLIFFENTTNSLLDQLNDNIELIYFQRRFKFNPLLQKNLIKKINEYDIIHIHMRYNLKYFFFLNLFNRFNTSIIFHDHYGNIDNNNTIGFIDKILIKRVPYIGVSDKLVTWAKNNGANKAYLLKNIIIKEKSFSKKRSPGSNRLIIVGNINEVKNQIFGLRIFKELIKVESYNLDIYGSIQDYDYYLLLKEYIKHNQLNNHVNFIFDCNNIQSVLHKYNYALHCSTSETGPLVLLEYMAHGLPFLTGNTGQVINFLKPKLDFLIINKFVVNDWIKGFKYLKERADIAMLSTTTILSDVAIWGALSVLTISISVEIYDKGSWGYGLLDGMYGIGAFFSIIIVGQLTKNWSRRIILQACYLFGFATLYFSALMPSIFLASIFFFILGININASRVITRTILMENINNKIMGRVQTVLGIYSRIMVVTSSLATGYIIENYSINAAVLFTCMHYFVAFLGISLVGKVWLKSREYLYGN